MDVLPTMAADSIDACVTDPPYHLVSIYKRFANDARNEKTVGNHAYGRHATGFMGKQWDGGDIAFRVETWREVYRVLKPGAHLLAFGGTRTFHRMACAIEDAGFEIRDTIQWLYGSGFPKSHDVSKGIDRAAGANRDVVARVAGMGKQNPEWNGTAKGRAKNSFEPEFDLTTPATDAARQWEGWGTALKPACEPIVLARKPLSERTVAANVLRWGTGAINVDGCRIEADPRPVMVRTTTIVSANSMSGESTGATPNGEVTTLGRWPANVIHDGSDEVVAAFPELTSRSTASFDGKPHGTTFGGNKRDENIKGTWFGDTGSAARFFYQGKADQYDRIGSKHPTVKPLDLMQYLVRLVTPKGGLVLDPFAGSGTTGEAAFREGMRAVLIECEAEYLKDIERRLELLMAGPDERTFKSQKARQNGKPMDAGPLFGGKSDWDEMWTRPFERPDLL
jgi:site-specific DNA-methyltransferase (adenine-specific)